MLKSILFFIISLLVLLRIRSVGDTIRGGIKFFKINNTIKLIYYFCIIYLFYTISFIIINEIPIFILLQYLFYNFIFIEIYNAFRLFIYTPITFHGFQFIGRILEKVNLKFAEFFGTLLISAETLFICILEILIISSLLSYNYVVTTDTIFDEKTITAYMLLTFGLLLYAMLTGSGGIWLMVANHHDIVWSKGRFNISAKTVGLTFFLFFIFGAFSINRIFYKNDVMGLLNRQSDTKIIEAIETFEGFETKLILETNSLNNSSINQNHLFVNDFNYFSYSDFEDYKKYSVDLYENDPLKGLSALTALIKQLSSKGMYHKMEVEILRAHYILKSHYQNFNYEGKISTNELEYIISMFDDIQEAIVESISRQNVESDVALFLFRDLISKDEQKILSEQPSWSEYNYHHNYRRRYEIGIRYLAELIFLYPEKSFEVENDILQIIERNKARNFNQIIDAKWLSNTNTLKAMLNENQCGLNYIISNFNNFGIGQYYDTDTTINFVIPSILNSWKNVSKNINGLMDNDELKKEISSMLVPEVVLQRMNNKDLLLSTDGFIQEIPFQYILNDLTMNSIKLIPSFSSLTDFPINSKNKLLAIASSNPDFIFKKHKLLNSKRELLLDTLLFSVPEVWSVAESAVKFLDSVVVKENVSESWFQDNINEYDIIHFAGHSDQFGIYINKDEMNDGIFSINEIESLKLKGQLIFLSSCDGAVGEYELGEGITSISKAFLKAGASGVIASLWKLNDEKTSELVNLFYNNYFQNFNPSSTLYKIQNEYESTFSKFKYPFVYVTYNNS